MQSKETTETGNVSGLHTERHRSEGMRMTVPVSVAALSQDGSITSPVRVDV